MALTDPDLVTEEGLPVLLPSGAEFSVLTSDEVRYVTERAARYLADNHLINMSDLQDIDRLLIMEVLCFRWGLWISRQRDYFGDPVDDTGALRRSLGDYSSEIRQLKKNIGIDKVARDRQKGEDAVATYLEQLRARAKEFGVTREKQLDKALELFNDLRSLITLHDNCLGGNTEVITTEGTRSLRDLAGQECVVLDGHGAWRPATVSSFGVQPLLAVELGRGRARKTVFATPEHRWFVRARNHQRHETTTAGLGVGDRLVSVFGHLPGNVRPSSIGVAAGVVFGDGCAPSGQPGSGAHVVLCGAKDAQLLKYFPDSPTRQVEAGIMVCDLPRSWKRAPSLDEGLPYLYGWLAGYLAADGTVSEAGGSPSITSHRRGDLEVARDVAYRLGIPTLGITEWTGPSSFGGEKTAYRLNFPIGGASLDLFVLDEHRRRAQSRPRLRANVMSDWKVLSVWEADAEEVFCATVPSTRSFTLADNLLTGNCDMKEQAELSCGTEDLLDWIRTIAVPEYEAIDNHFRTHQQKYYIREM